MNAKLTQQAFTLPLLVVLLLVSFYTLGYAIYLSVHDIDLMSPPPFDFIGMANLLRCCKSHGCGHPFGTHWFMWRVQR